ncbi:MAG: TVP38/TMEM64 family protein [Clostridiales bacterium]|nr:TVP38/TMEM64 family protein [Clostridiales bacterium]
MKLQTKTGIIKLSVSMLCILMIAFCGVYVYDRSLFVYYLSITLLSGAAVALCAVNGDKYPHLERTIGVVAVVCILAAAIYIIYYQTGLNEKFTDFDAVRQFIVDSGFWGFAVFIGLTIVQVVVLPIPAAITILLGVAIYGPTVSFILSTIGTVIGSILSFALGKVFGRKLCNWMFGEEATEKYAKILGEKGRFIFIIMLLFPAFPDDMLCMIAGITTMSYMYFTVVCVLTRPVMIGITAYLGSGVIPFEGWGIPVWIALILLLFAAFVVITGVKKRMERPTRRAKKE